MIDPQCGKIVAGARYPQDTPLEQGKLPLFADTLMVMKAMTSGQNLGFSARQNTVIGVVATNARLDKEQTNKVAQMAQDGLARAIRPAHTMVDGDTLFALSTGVIQADVYVVGAFAAEVVAQAILRAVRAAKPAGNLPAVENLNFEQV